MAASGRCARRVTAYCHGGVQELRSPCSPPREALLSQWRRPAQQIYEGCRDQDRGGASRKPRNRSKGAPDGAPFPLMGACRQPVGLSPSGDSQRLPRLDRSGVLPRQAAPPPGHLLNRTGDAGRAPTARPSFPLAQPCPWRPAWRAAGLTATPPRQSALPDCRMRR
jgi:hypothetical protein